MRGEFVCLKAKGEGGGGGGPPADVRGGGAGGDDPVVEDDAGVAVDDRAPFVMSLVRSASSSLIFSSR